MVKILSGWLHTGDIGKWLPTGGLQIIDRKNEMFKLSQGDFVSPIQIEAIYANSPLITQIYVTGKTERSFLVGIVVLDLPRFKQLPLVKALDGKESIEMIMENKEVKNAVIAELNKYAKQNGLQTIELIRNVHLTLQVLLNTLFCLRAYQQFNTKIVQFSGIYRRKWLDNFNP